MSKQQSAQTNSKGQGQLCENLKDMLVEKHQTERQIVDLERQIQKLENRDKSKS